MTTLALAVDADDELWTLDDLPTPEAPYVEVGSELIEVRSRFPSQIYSLTGQVLPPRIRVRRGIAGTTAASHIQGSTLTPNYGLGGGGGAGGVTVDNGDTQEEVATIIAPGADLSTPGEATLGKWTLVGAENETADLSVSATASGTGDALADRTVIATGNADATANTVVSAVDGDAEALTVVTVTGVQDGLATTTVDTVGGTADVSIAATATDAEFGNAYANTAATSAGGNADASTSAAASGDGDANIIQSASVEGAGLATASVMTSRGAAEAGMRTETDATSARLGFNGTAPIAKPTGVAVTAEGIHAALVSLGLIAA